MKQKNEDKFTKTENVKIGKKIYVLAFVRFYNVLRVAGQWNGFEKLDLGSFILILTKIYSYCEKSFCYKCVAQRKF